MNLNVLRASLFCLILTACSRPPTDVPEFNPADFEAFNSQAASALTQALSSWRTAAPTPPAAANRAVEFARLSLAYDRYDWALQALDWALAHESKRGDWLYLRAHALKGLEREAEAIAAMQESMQHQPNYSAARILFAQWALEAGEPARAASMFAGHPVPRNNSAAWLAVQGRIALAQDKSALAAELLRGALDADPEATQLNYPLGLALRALGDLESARTLLEARGDNPPRLEDPLMAAVEATRVDPQALRSRAADAALAGEHDRAVTLYRQALAGENDLESRVNLGISEYRSGDSVTAENTLREVLNEEPDHPRAWFALGTLMANQGRDLEAISAYEHALASDPDLLDARHNLGNALRRSGDHSVAIEAFLQVIESDPSRLAAWQGLTQSRIAMGNWAQAAIDLEQALAVHPDDAVLTLGWIQLLAAAPEPLVRNPELALELANRLFDEELTLPRGEALAMALAAVGRYDDAAALQQRLIDSARSAGRPDLLISLESALASYQSGQPWRLELN